MSTPKITKGPFLLDGHTAYRVICPRCWVEAILDEDQFRGVVNIQCDCGYHETHDLSKEAKAK